MDPAVVSPGSDRKPDVALGWHAGDRDALRPLFELAEDSRRELDSYLHLGRVLVAEVAGEIVGHLQLVDAAEPGTAELKNMAVREDLQGCGVGGTLVRAAVEALAEEGVGTLRVATAAAGIGNLRFYQRLGFRMTAVERDAFTEEAGYPPTDVDGIPLRDRVWLDITVAPPPGRR